MFGKDKRYSSKHTAALLQSAGIGVIAGMRSMSAPAFVSNSLARAKTRAPRRNGFKVMARDVVSSSLALMAAGEMMVDKLPIVPARIEPPSLAGRMVSGAFSAATWCAFNRKAVIPGAVAGAAAALASSYAFYYLRKSATNQLGLPDRYAAIAEDAIVIGTGLGLFYDGFESSGK